MGILKNWNLKRLGGCHSKNIEKHWFKTLHCNHSGNGIVTFFVRGRVLSRDRYFWDRSSTQLVKSEYFRVIVSLVGLLVKISQIYYLIVTEGFIDFFLKFVIHGIPTSRFLCTFVQPFSNLRQHSNAHSYDP